MSNQEKWVTDAAAKAAAAAEVWKHDGANGAQEPVNIDVTSAAAVAQGKATQAEWDRLAKPQGQDRVTVGVTLASTAHLPEDHPDRKRAIADYEASKRGDASSTRADSVPDHIHAQCPPDRHPVADGRGGYRFERNDARADSARVERHG